MTNVVLAFAEGVSRRIGTLAATFDWPQAA